MLVGFGAWGFAEIRSTVLGVGLHYRAVKRRLSQLSSGMHEAQWNLEPKASKRFRLQGLGFRV